MLTTFAVTFFVFSLAVIGLGIGWLVAGKTRKGSCGGLGGNACGVCKNPCDERAKQLDALREQS